MKYVKFKIKIVNFKLKCVKFKFKICKFKIKYNKFYMKKDKLQLILIGRGTHKLHEPTNQPIWFTFSGSEQTRNA